jgi:hypothetical protein
MESTSKPLSNPDAEACAQKMAKLLPNMKAAVQVLRAYADSRPDLKNWEVSALGSRAEIIYRERVPWKPSPPLQDQ